MNTEFVVSGLEKHAVVVRTFKMGGTPVRETLTCSCGGFAASSEPLGTEWEAERHVFRVGHTDR